MNGEIPEWLTRVFPGALGSLVSMLFVRDTWLRRAGMFAAGCALAYFGTPWVAKASDLDRGFTGFLLGLFGMAVVGKIFETLRDLEPATFIRDWLRKRAGLPPMTKGFDHVDS